MILILKNDGTLSILEPTTLTVGSANTSDVILLSNLGYSSYTLSVELPTGDILDNMVMSPLGEYPITNNQGVITTINAFYYHINASWTKVPGTLKITAYGRNNVGGVLASYLVQVSVLGVVPTTIPQVPSNDAYADILDALGALKSIYDALKVSYDGLSNEFAGAITAHNESPTAHANQLDTIRTSINNLQTAVQTADGKAVTAKNRADAAYALAEQAKATADAALAGERYIGMVTVNTLTGIDTVLNNYVTNQGYTLQKGDVVFVVLSVAGETDKAYRYIYFGGTVGWSGYEIPTVESASNTDKGLVKGTYTTSPSSSTKMMVDIANGVIVGIYVLDETTGEDTWLDLDVFLNRNKASVVSAEENIAKIIDGTTPVGNASHLGGKTEYQLNVASATKATQDGNGNNIVNVYQTKADGATKQFVKDYALPKAFGDIAYLKDTNTLVTTAPSTGSDYTGVVTTNSLSEGNNTLFSNLKYPITSQEITLNKSMSIASTLTWYITSSVGVDITLTYNIYYVVGSSRTLISTVQSNKITAVSGETYRINLNNVLSLLGDEEKTIVPTESNIEFELIANASYSCTFNLVSYTPSNLSYSRLDVLSPTLNVNYIGSPFEKVVTYSDFTLDAESGKYKATIYQTEHKQPSDGKYFVTAYYNTTEGLKYIALDYVLDAVGNVVIYCTEALTIRVLIACAATQSEADAIKSLETSVRELYSIIYGSFITTVQYEFNYLKLATIPATITVDNQNYHPIANSRLLPVKIEGRTVSKNNFLDPDTIIESDILTKNNDGTFTINGTVSIDRQEYLNYQNSLPCIVGHNYLYKLKLVSGSVNVAGAVPTLTTNGYSINLPNEYDSMPTTAGTVFAKTHQVVTSSDAVFVIEIKIDSGVVFNNAVFKVEWVDLTALLNGEELTGEILELVKSVDIPYGVSLDNVSITQLKSLQADGTAVRTILNISNNPIDLKSAGSVKSEIDIARQANGLYKISLLDKISSVTLSTLNWTAGDGYYYSEALSGNNPTSGNISGDITVTGFVTVPANWIINGTAEEGSVAIAPNGNIYVKIPSTVTTLAQFNTYIANRVANYDKGSITTTLLGYELPIDDVTLVISSLGYIQVVATNDKLAFPGVTTQIACE